MGIRNYLVEGISGSGKTAVADELQRRGYHVIHGDRELAYVGGPATGAGLPRPKPSTGSSSAAWLHQHWIWPVSTVQALAADRQNEMTFFCGGSRNIQQFIGLFHGVFVLHVDFDTLSERLARRLVDEFGGRENEREFILRLWEKGNDLADNAVLIDATAPLASVVDEIIQHSIKLNTANQSAQS